MIYKKISIVLICLVCLSSCGWLLPDDDTPSFYMDWRLNNTTMETIVLNQYLGKFHESMTIPQECDTLLGYSGFSKEDDTFFDYLWDGARDSIVIKLNGEVVRVWRKSEKSNPGKQLFNRSYWKKSTGTRKDIYNEEKPCTIWTFELTPEDIAP